jgi:hypothetical protein
MTARRAGAPSVPPCSVQVRLQEVRGEIERLVAQRTALADQAALATLSVTWMTPVAAVAVTQEGWDLGTEIDAAAAQTVAALQGVARALVWVAVVAVPLALPPPLLFAVALVVVRRHRHRGDAEGDAGSPGGRGGTGGEGALLGASSD